MHNHMVTPFGDTCAIQNHLVNQAEFVTVFELNCLADLRVLA